MGDTEHVIQIKEMKDYFTIVFVCLRRSSYVVASSKYEGMIMRYGYLVSA
jgi:hypothetical protein